VEEVPRLGWNADLVGMRTAALISNADAREYHGLRMKEPAGFLFDPLGRARLYLEKFRPPAL
jgi:hypothetical protein